MDKKKAFTLAELMIVLAILGVIAAILTPIAFNAMPDENKLRFKKAYYTLQRTTDAVLNSDLYPDGDLSKVSSNAGKNFCLAFSDMLNTVYDNCEGTGTITTSTGDLGNVYYIFSGISDSLLSNMDTVCAAKAVVDPLKAGAASGSFPKFITQDGIYWWGFDYNFDVGHTIGQPDNCYALVCVDVDGTGPEPPFAFGIRKDGRVQLGLRARQWINEGAKSSIQTEN